MGTTPDAAGERGPAGTLNDTHVQVADGTTGLGAPVAATLASLAGRLAVALDCSECCFYEYLADRDTVLPQAIWKLELTDDDRAWVGVENHLNRQRRVAPVFHERRLVVTQADEEELDAGERESMAYWGEQTALYAPITSGDELLGVVELIEHRRRRDFGEADLRLVTALADMAGLAIENARLSHRLEEQATTDGLTGLFNHRYFYERLNAEIARARRYELQLSLLMLDLDDFKHFNDLFGHQAGDRVLAEVGRIMRAQLRNGVDIPCRYGGEEFAVILPHTPAPGAAVVGRRLSAHVNAILGAGAPGSAGEPARLAGERLRRTIADTSFPGRRPDETAHITVSVGIADHPAQAADADGLVGCADAALYAAKRHGKNRVEVYEEVPPAP
jgi:diguanylate cyclase (GGDEF)-like protein